MMEYILTFLQKTTADLKELEAFIDDAEKLLQQWGSSVEEAVALYQQTHTISDSLAIREAIAMESGISVYTVNAVVIILSAQWLWEDYKTSGYTEPLFWDTMADAIYKLYECKTVKGVWGTFVEYWFDYIFKKTVFRLGRFEYEIAKFPHDAPVTIHGHTIHPGDTVYNVHIPSCGPMPRDVRLDSYRKAYNFFAKDKETIIFACHSWLTYAKNREIFPPHLNMVDFLNDWTILKNQQTPEFTACWRLFGKPYSGNPHNLPTDTTAQRAMADWLKAGNLPGVGYGIMLFDGEKILQ